MIIKTDQRFSGYSHGTPHIMPLEMHDYDFMKQASDMHPDIENYIKNVRSIPGKNILLIDALGAGEVWGANINGDFYGRDELMREENDAGYRSFMHHAYPYKHHLNEARKKDASKRFGEKVVLSAYHPGMDRVHLIAIVDAAPDRAGDIVSRCDAGEYPDVSMACGVAYDKCSICGSLHRTRKDYCSHARNQLNHLMPDGQKVFLRNYRPRFHDISFVMIGADRAAKVLRKVASAGKRAEIIKHINPDKEDVKITKIARPISGIELDSAVAVMQKVQSTEPSIGRQTLRMLSDFPLEDIFKTATDMCISFRPEEFQYLVMNHYGNEKQAEEYADNGTLFSLQHSGNPSDHVLPDGEFSNKVATVLSLCADDRSGLYPYLLPRVFTKQAGIFDTPSFESGGIGNLVWPALGGLFLAYKKQIPATLQKTIARGAAAIGPFVTPMALGMAYHLAYNIGKDVAFKYDDTVDLDEGTMLDWNDYGKESSVRDAMYGIGSVPLIYMYANHVKKKAQDPGAWDQTSPLSKLIANHPDISSFISLLAVPKVVKTITADRKLLSAIGNKK